MLQSGKSLRCRVLVAYKSGLVHLTADSALNSAQSRLEELNHFYGSLVKRVLHLDGVGRF